MREQLEKRLQELHAEFEKGQEKLTELEAQANTLRTTILRISGAIQVLDEELQKANAVQVESSNGEVIGASREVLNHLP
jgi:predicted nuclease with TOPRIM domain